MLGVSWDDQGHLQLWSLTGMVTHLDIFYQVGSVIFLIIQFSYCFLEIAQKASLKDLL